MFIKPIETFSAAIALAILALAPAGAADTSLEVLRERCQLAREARIAPLREAAIEDCVSQPRSTRSREDCERMHRDFGMGGPIVGGGFRAPLFMDLPECVELHRAEDRAAGRGTSR